MPFIFSLLPSPPPDIALKCAAVHSSAALSELFWGFDSYQEFPLCPGLPNQKVWPAKRLDSGEPTARERFVLRAHFDAGTRLGLPQDTEAP